VVGHADVHVVEDGLSEGGVGVGGGDGWIGVGDFGVLRYLIRADIRPWDLISPPLYLPQSGGEGFTRGVWFVGFWAGRQRLTWALLVAIAPRRSDALGMHVVEGTFEFLSAGGLSEGGWVVGVGDGHV